ncbi:cyanophycinase [Pontibacter korlensis]|uniref:Cyanophycinase n=1 Tax=Pontibacter korlensis TaxID=400092 RepID=A0A0E3UZ73_9BACT|nr:cyanophycinase [Pontibacter korlensis]AKD05066.1 cyanophycinase [Pontibacter korlensis]
MAKQKESDKKQVDNYKKDSEAPLPKGRLLAIGGKEDKGEEDGRKKEQTTNKEFESEEILKFFVSQLKGDKPTIAVIPTASNIPDEMGKDYVKLFKDLGIENVEVLDIRDRADAADPRNCDIVEKATAIYFTGGDQLRLTSILGGTRVLQLMKKRYTYDDILIAGTSAGATALSTPMIYEVDTKGGYLKGDVRVTTGLEFLKNVAVDTHFIQRGRLVRMAQCITTNPGCIGVGLEEDTAAFITEGHNLEVIGSGLITIVDGMGLTKTNIYDISTGEVFSAHDLRVHLLAKGERYIFPTFEQLHA